MKFKICHKTSDHVYRTEFSRENIIQVDSIEQAAAFARLFNDYFNRENGGLGTTRVVSISEIVDEKESDNGS